MKTSISLTGVGSLVGAMFALSNGSQHIRLIGRSGRTTLSNSLISFLQSHEGHYITMSRCDVAAIEEAYMLGIRNGAMPLNGLIHASACHPLPHLGAIATKLSCSQSPCQIY